MHVRGKRQVANGEDGFSPLGIYPIRQSLVVIRINLSIWLVRKTPTDQFYRLAHLLMLLIAVALLWQGARGFMT